MGVERLTGELKRVKTDLVKREGGGGVVERESDGQMWRDKRERVGLRWKLSTNLKECIGKRRLLASCA